MPEETEANRINWHIHAAKGGGREGTSDIKEQRNKRPRRVHQVAVQGVATEIPQDMPQGALQCSDIPGIVRFDSDQEVVQEVVALQGVDAEAVEAPLMKWSVLMHIDMWDHFGS